MFGAVFGFAVLALGIGVTRFWKEITPGAASAIALGEATHNVLRMKYWTAVMAKAVTTKMIALRYAAGAFIT
jgi:citrate/tricarballylate utilization protein